MNTDSYIESHTTKWAAIADPVVAVRRKRDKKKTSDPVASTIPPERKPFTDRLLAKKKIFRRYYQGVKPGGDLRHMISAMTAMLLDDELAHYVCLTSMIILTDINGNKIMGPDGKV